MKFIADFHVHSHYSIATSKDLVPEYLDYWARLKGIRVVGTGDFTHPGWLKELESKLQPAEPGLFRLKKEFVLDQANSFSGEGARFVLTAEISNIYKKDEKVRKVHNVILAPDFDIAKRIQSKLEKLGNIRSDGRPILGLDSRDLLEIVLDCSERALLVPAHIWTPWFSALGAKSGFDNIEECYGDLSDHIYAVETGLSSDPPMNWMCSFLDRYTLISNSDAHSPDKMGREANIFNTDLSYDGITEAIKTGSQEHFLGTVEFFPQEGKYHYDGHRKCGILWDPLQTLKNNEICPVCGKKVTVGVMNRVAQLADRDIIDEKRRRVPFFSIVSLKEILSEIMGCAPGTKKVSLAYRVLVEKAGSEFNLLLDMSTHDIKLLGNDVLAEAIRRMRNREIRIKEGFDGEFGQVRVFPEGNGKLSCFQDSLLMQTDEKRAPVYRRPLIHFDLKGFRRLKALKTSEIQEEKQGKKVPSITHIDLFGMLNEEQRRAAMHFHGPAVVIAGPGTGKTRTLTARIAHLILNRSVPPEHILAFAFTNKAVGEMRERLDKLLVVEHETTHPKVSTFHSFGLWILKQHCEKFGRERSFSIVHEEDKREILRRKFAIQSGRLKYISDSVTRLKQELKDEGDIEDSELAVIFTRYQRVLKEQNIFDLDDLLYFPVKVVSQFPEMLNLLRDRFKWICIDEYQDLNYAQYQLVRLLMPSSNADLFVIGDPDQAIYGFRGADMRFIRSFLEDYPEATAYKLNKSYRCSDTILRASSQVIDKKHDRAILEGLMKGVEINVSQHPTDKSEAEFVARSVESMMGGVRFFSIDSQITEGEKATEINSLSEFAVLCRLNSQLKLLEKAFVDHGIPYQTVGTDPFFQKHPMRGILDLMKIAKNPKNTFLIDVYLRKGVIYREDVKFLTDLVKRGSMVKDTVEQVVDKFYSREKSEQDALFRQLFHLAEEFGDSIEQFFDFVATGTGVDMYRRDTENVTLMTLHAAKGLEFQCVFIVGCENGLLPYSLFEHQMADFEEERRLFYVGMTRAKHFLFLSHARKRFLFGREYCLQKSPFLDAIEDQLVKRSEREYRRTERREDSQLDLF